MKAVVFTGARTLALQTFDDPTPGPDEVVLEIKASGLCGTDLHTYRSDKGSPFIAGHEPCGEVVARGSAVDPRIVPDGARMMVHHYDGCRQCSNCLGGWTQLCDEGSVIYGRTGHGAHARYMKVPARTLVPLPDALSFTEGAAVSCGTGTAFGAIRRMKMEGGATLAVIGQGPVGLSATMLANAMGARVIAVDIDADRLQRARTFGATETVDASAAGMVEQIKDLTDGHGADYVMECSGNGRAAVDALRSTRTWGTISYVGMGAEATFAMNDDIIKRQVTMLGSWTFSTIGQKECAAFCAARGLPVEDLFTHRFTLDQADAAYKLFDTQTTGKAVIHPS